MSIGTWSKVQLHVSTNMAGEYCIGQYWSNKQVRWRVAGDRNFLHFLFSPPLYYRDMTILAFKSKTWHGLWLQLQMALRAVVSFYLFANSTYIPNYLHVFIYLQTSVKTDTEWWGCGRPVAEMWRCKVNEIMSNELSSSSENLLLLFFQLENLDLHLKHLLKVYFCSPQAEMTIM